MTENVSFTFRALRANGAVETGVVEAPDRDAAASLIGTRGLFPIEISAREATSRNFRRIGADDLAAGLRALASLLRSGLPMSRAISILQELTTPAWAAALPGIRRRIEQGESLAAALEKSTLPLPPHVIGIVRAGEAGSGIAEAVETAAGLLEARAAARAALRNALAYPMLLAVAGSASVLLLVTVVLPRFAEILTDAGQTLPTATRVLLALGRIAPVAAGPAAVAVAAAVFVGRWAVARHGVRARWHAFLLSVPLVGAIRRSAATANAASTLAALLHAGVPLSAALPHAGKASGDAAIDAGFQAARNRIAAGEPLSAALAAGGTLSGATIRLLRVGEEAGDLAGMLRRAAEIESAQALRKLQRVLRLVEPALILLFGGIVMLVAAALLQAMYGYRLSS
ncbi:MAG TPA: type II secretion system F family protein [Longimicrobiales bacterium]